MMDSAIVDLMNIADLRSILLVRLYALGDIVLTLPLVDRFRQAFPTAWIGYLVRERFAGALAGDTGLDEVIPLPERPAGQLATIRFLRRKRPDIAVDLLSSPRSALLTRLSGAGLRIGMDTRRRNGFYHAVLPRAIIRDGKRVRCYTMESNLELCRMLGLPDCGTGRGSGEGEQPWGFPAADPAAGWARSFVHSQGDTGKGIAGIVPGSTYASKGWPVERFVELAGRISSELGMRPLILWGPGEEGIASEIAAAVPDAIIPPATGVAEAGALISRMKILVGIDSGPKHIAVLLGIPTVTLFGPTDPRIWDPMDEMHRAIWKGLDCADGCREKTCTPNRCMLMITVDEVLDEVRSVTGGGA
jgi:ADP-heptose:LPS heptosyltransferase